MAGLSSGRFGSGTVRKYSSDRPPGAVEDLAPAFDLDADPDLSVLGDVITEGAGKVRRGGFGILRRAIETGSQRQRAQRNGAGQPGSAVDGLWCDCHGSPFRTGAVGCGLTAFPAPANLPCPFVTPGEPPAPLQEYDRGNHFVQSALPAGRPGELAFRESG